MITLWCIRTKLHYTDMIAELSSNKDRLVPKRVSGIRLLFADALLVRC